jgi:hypothetical protein
MPLRLLGGLAAGAAKATVGAAGAVGKGALAIAPAAIGASGGILGGFFGSTQKKNEAAVAKYNAAVMRKQAESIRMRTKFQQERNAEEGARIEGELRAGIGGAGIVSTQGAPLLALALQRSESSLENYMIGYEGRIEAEQAENKALEFDMQKRFLKIGARQAVVGGFLGAGASAFQGFSQIPQTTTTGSTAKFGGGPGAGFAKGTSSTATAGAGRF